MDRTQNEVVKELEKAGFRYRNTLSFGDVVLLKRSGPVNEFAQVDGDGLVNGDDLESFLAQTLDMKAPKSQGLADSIRPGDRVTIITPHGQKQTGRAVMKGPHGWVLNLGGAHGTPGIADDENTIEVRKSRSGGTDAVLAREVLTAAKELAGSEADQVSEVQSALEELDDALSAAMDAARDAETKARAVGGEVSRVVAGQLDLYTWRTLKAFRESGHQPGSVASLNEFLDGHMRELVETGEEMAAKVAGFDEEQVADDVRTTASLMRGNAGGKTMSRERMTAGGREADALEGALAVLEKSLVAFDDKALEQAADAAAKAEKKTVVDNMPGVTLKDNGDQNAKANANWPLTDAEKTKVAKQLVRLAKALVQD